ncbi:putative ribonuclease H protein [Glycine soja]
MPIPRELRFQKVESSPKLESAYSWTVPVEDVLDCCKGFTSNNLCSICGSHAETTEVHLLRDCSFATKLWNYLTKGRLPRDFFSALHVAWQRNVSKLWIETDSAMSLDLISKPLLATHHYAPLLRRIQQFQQKQWHLRITHTYREGNCVAD